MSVPCPPRRGYPPADLIRQREMKWVEMTSHWEKTMSRRYKKVRGAWPHPALAKFAPPMSHYLLPFLPTPPPPPKWPLPNNKSCSVPANKSRGGWPSWPNGTDPLASPTGKDAVQERHPLSPACPVLAPALRSPCVSEEQPWYLSGKRVGRGPASPSQSPWPL